jgi:dihydrofolate reductase
MGKLVITEFISLDGVIEDPGGAEGFRHGGWTFAYTTGPEGDKFKLDETLAAAALLLGRVTYEGFAAAWPTMEGTGEFGEKMNGMPKYVVSSTLEEPGWSNSTVLRGEAAEVVAQLKRDVDGEILVAGSGQLARMLIEHDLVDEVRLMVFPVVLGTGKRLFGETSDKKPMRLARSQPLGDGVTLVVYEPVR